MINSKEVIDNLQGSDIAPEDLIIILGPTASGKTKLAVQLATQLNAEIISADSRQVYKQMNIGTGKDLKEYGCVPYHLIDILNPGDKYNVSSFLTDFDQAYQAIRSKGKRVIVCGGTGFYIQSLLSSRPYTQVPIDLHQREKWEQLSKDDVKSELLTRAIPSDFEVDFSSKKRMIRALEIIDWLQENTSDKLIENQVYQAYVVGLNPSVELRRQRITDRLYERLEQGMLEEVKALQEAGVSYEELEYYGLEYKYIAYYLQGKMSYEDFVKKLETEIHRYAKRQMTYFRKMEKDGVKINWYA